MRRSEPVRHGYSSCQLVGSLVAVPVIQRRSVWVTVGFLVYN